MTNPVLHTLFGEIELQPAASPAGAPSGMRAYVLLPELDELLGVPGFGLKNPILAPRKSSRRPSATVPAREVSWH
jgi:hypothetical protein